MKTQIIFLCLCFIVFFCACKKGQDDIQKINCASELMEEHPDSALTLLNSIKLGDLSRESDRAKYGLLKTQARHKNDILLNSEEDSIIEFCVAYYFSKSELPMLMKSLFYEGVHFYHSSYFSQAIASSLEARKISISLNDKYWQAKCAELISNIFTASFDNDDALTFANEATKCYALAGRRDNYLFSLSDIAVILSNSEKYSEALAQLDTIHILATSEYPNPYLFVNEFRLRFSIHTYLNNVHLRQIALDSLAKYEDLLEKDTHFYSHLSQLKLAEGNVSDAIEYQREAENHIKTEGDKASALYSLFLINKEQGNYNSAFENIDSVLKLQGNELTHAFHNQALGAHRDYLNKQYRIQRLHSENLLSIIFITILLTIVIVFCGIVFYRQRMKIKKMERDKDLIEICFLLQEIENLDKKNNVLSQTLSSQNTLVENLKQKIVLIRSKAKETEERSEDLYRDKWGLFNIVCHELFEKGSSPDARPSILNIIEEEITKFKSKKNLQRIENEVNLNMSGIADTLRSECTFLKEEDIVFIILNYAGFSPRAICIFTDIKIKYYYNKKTRLTTRIVKSDAPHKELLISKLR